MNGRNKMKKVDRDRDEGPFLALPFSVLESAGWRQAGHVARSLLIDVMRQYNRKNNGRLVACDKYLRPLGWKSHDVITRALRELLACGLLVETRKGARPNLTTWFALSWYQLHQRDGLDISTKLYRTGAYRNPEPRPVKNAGLIPSARVGQSPIAPPRGPGVPPPAPPNGAMRCHLAPSPTPCRGEYLRKPSAELGSEDLTGPQSQAQRVHDKNSLVYWLAVPGRTAEKGVQLGVGTWAQAEASGQEYRAYMRQFIGAFNAAGQRDKKPQSQAAKGVE